MSRPRSWANPWVTMAITAVATAVIGGPIRTILIKRGLMDVPNHRSSHVEPIARGGGLAALAGAGTAAVVTGNAPSAARVTAVAALAAVGLADDTTGHLPTSARLVSQMVAGSALLADPGPGRILDGVITAGVVNVVNFMDGINGITGMTAVVWGINAILVEDDNDGDLAVLGALVAGAGFGFLPHNLPSAKMFLGDVGSYAFGAAMAAGILSQRTIAGRYRAAAPLLLSGIDVAQAMFHRTRNGERIGEAHRDHIYQQSVDDGLSHSATALIHTGLAALVARGAQRGGRYGWIGSAAAIGAYLSLPLALGARRRGPDLALTGSPLETESFLSGRASR